MIAAAQEADRKLMIAYRLHYEPFNRKVMELCAQKAFGDDQDLLIQQLPGREGPEHPAEPDLGGGPVGDIGIY